MWEQTPAAAREAHIAVLSVKPQHAPAAMASIRGHVRPDALVLSIVAGLSIPRIQESLSHPHVVRAMPNTPARIGQGITVAAASPGLDETHKAQAMEILGALGDVISVDDEEMLDMATALSGTGPAYVFLFMEAMVDAGVHLGFPREIAERLVAQTVQGSAMFFQKSHATPLAQLRNAVTSPAGTTAAALFELEKAGFRTAISNAVWPPTSAHVEPAATSSAASPADKQNNGIGRQVTDDGDGCESSSRTVAKARNHYSRSGQLRLQFPSP
jgi:pyrroline-5-carboxylate reductase